MQDMKGDESMIVDIKTGYVTMKDVEPGDCFCYQGEVFIKCKEQNNNQTGVRLKDGELYFFGSGEVVKPLSLKVVQA